MPTRPHRGPFLVALAATALAATGWRSPLWYDDAYTVLAPEPERFHLLLPWLHRALSLLQPHGLFPFRLLPLLLFLALILATARLARRLDADPTVAALWVAATPLALRYAIEVRTYLTLALGAAAVLACLLRIRRHPTRRAHLALGLTGGFCVWAHPTTLATVLLPAGLTLLTWTLRDASRRPERLRRGALTAALQLALAAPVLVWLRQAHTIRAARGEVYATLSLSSLTQCVQSLSPGGLLWPLGLALLVLGLLRARAWAVLAALPWLGVALASLAQPMFTPRVFAPLIPLHALLVARLPRRRPTRSAVVSLIALAALGSAVWVLRGDVIRADIRPLARTLSRTRAPHEPVFLHPNFVQITYRANVELHLIPDLDPVAPCDLPTPIRAAETDFHTLPHRCHWWVLQRGHFSDALLAELPKRYARVTDHGPAPGGYRLLTTEDPLPWSAVAELPRDDHEPAALHLFRRGLALLHLQDPRAKPTLQRALDAAPHTLPPRTLPDDLQRIQHALQRAGR